MIVFIEYNIVFAIAVCVTAYFDDFKYYFARTKEFFKNPIAFTRGWFYGVCEKMKARYSKGLLLIWIKNRIKPFWKLYFIFMFVFFWIESPELRSTIIELLGGIIQILKDLYVAIKADYKVAYLSGLLVGTSFTFLKKNKLNLAIMACACMFVFTGCDMFDKSKHAEKEESPGFMESWRGDPNDEPTEDIDEIMKKLTKLNKGEKCFYNSAQIQGLLRESFQAERQLTELQKTVDEVVNNCQYSIVQYDKRLGKRTYRSKDEFYYKDNERANLEGKRSVCDQILSTLNAVKIKNDSISKEMY